MTSLRKAVVAIDMGSEFTRVLMSGAGVLEARSCDPWTGKAVVAHGVIVDEDAAGRLLERMLSSVGLARSVPRVLASCPLHIDCAAVRLRQALRLAGAEQVEVVRSTAAAARGAGVDMTSHLAEMLVDIGAGLTEVAVVRDGDILHARTIPVGARELGEAPSRTLSGREERSVPPAMLADHVASVWRGLPGPVQREVSETGVVLTGGGALRADLIAAMVESTRLRVRVPNSPAQAVIRGLAQLTPVLRAA